jgi:hypothetical protein
MRGPTTTARGPKPRARRRPPGRLDSHNHWTKPRWPVTTYHQRPHSGIGYRTPAEVARTWQDPTVLHNAVT